MTDEATPDPPHGCIYLRAGAALVEVDPDGFVRRDVQLTRDGRAKGAWGPPLGSETRQAWRGVMGSPISRDEFERLFDQGRRDPVPFRSYPVADRVDRIESVGCATLAAVFAVWVAIWLAVVLVPPALDGVRRLIGGG